MNINTLNDIAAIRKNVRNDLRETLSSLSSDDAEKSEPGGWTVAYIAEHVAITEAGIGKLIARLIQRSRETNSPPTDAPIISDHVRSIFAGARNMKAEAPEMVRPSGTMTTAEAIVSLDTTSAELDAMMADADKFDTSDAKFPHPYFGDLTAPEWYAVLAFHETRHLAQIKRSLAA